MPKAWHPRRWLDWCMPEDEKKEIKQFLTDEKQYKVVDIISNKMKYTQKLSIAKWCFSLTDKTNN